MPNLASSKAFRSDAVGAILYNEGYKDYALAVSFQIRVENRKEALKEFAKYKKVAGYA